MRHIPKILLLTVLGLIIFITNPGSALAIEDPLESPNNVFGIHIVDTHDLKDAAALVNSQGGDWGYVTLVIREDQRSLETWQRVFDEMSQLHLVPIVRIATVIQDVFWKKPEVQDIDNWVSFLNRLDWPIKNRYVVVLNEPNHAKEWGGGISPVEYTRYLKEISLKLKTANENFFVLQAGLDASAPNSTETMSEDKYVREMIESEPKIFDYIDGWASHSYPNPAFSGPADGYGRGSVRTYEWELELLKTLGVDKNLPVFITETGWVHNKDGQENTGLPTQTLGDLYKIAFFGAWTDTRVAAVTPFIFNYQESPFDTFSWKKQGEGEFYDFYSQIRLLPKRAGLPKLEKNAIASIKSFSVVPNGSKALAIARIFNSDSRNWTDPNIELTNQKGSHQIDTLTEAIEPGGTRSMPLTLSVEGKSGERVETNVFLKDSEAEAQIGKINFVVI